jgi:diadenosine tetraphosphate (Ap4A) HIT family hydrolase
MEMDDDCLYCSRNNKQKDLMIEIADLGVSTLFLFKEQSYRGRCVLAYKDHVNSFYELKEEDRNAFMNDVSTVANVLTELFHPDKINFGFYSDKLHHLHAHIVPKYVGGTSWGKPFIMNPNKVFMNEKGLNEIVEALKRSFQ